MINWYQFIISETNKQKLWTFMYFTFLKGKVISDVKRWLPHPTQVNEDHPLSLLGRSVFKCVSQMEESSQEVHLFASMCAFGSK